MVLKCVMFKLGTGPCKRRAEVTNKATNVAPGRGGNSRKQKKKQWLFCAVGREWLRKVVRSSRCLQLPDFCV